MPQQSSSLGEAALQGEESCIAQESEAAETGKTEPSAIQDDYPPAPSRVFYRLTDAGWTASVVEISDPVMTLYQYSREQRSTKKSRYASY